LRRSDESGINFDVKMHDSITSERHQRVFNAVLSGIGQMGYRGPLLERNYHFTDWFDSTTEQSTIPAAAFGRTPVDYDSACIAVFFQNGGSPPLRYRALGAPFAIEVQESGIVPWFVGHEASTTQRAGNRIPADAMDCFFRSIEQKWSPVEVLRAKNIGKPVGPTEIDWVDRGLIPALEKEISTKLDRLLREALAAGEKAHRKSTGRAVDIEALYRLVFRFVAAKVFHDRRVRGFVQLDANEDARLVLQTVCSFYNESDNHVSDRATQEAVATALWTKLGFQNLSVDALALIAEDTLIDSDSRKEHGIHSTPRSIARYVVEHLPIGDIDEDKRIIVEPCSGHGVFLVAALKRLRDLLGTGWTEQERHRYFIKRLHGFERDAFAREVNKLSLTLADFPNPNGWSLHAADVFTSHKFTDALGEARIVLCNPPFEDFKRPEKAKYGSAVGTSKPHDVLQRVLRHCHQEACLGFVLPCAFVDGQSYRQVRRELAERFASIDLVALPDKVFRHAEVETVLLLAHSPEPHDRAGVHFSEVLKPQLPHFLESGVVGRMDTASFSVTEAETKGFHVPVMQEIWERLAHLPRLGSIAEIHRGVAWQPPFDETKYLSEKERPGWWRGLWNVERGFETFSVGKIYWLNPNPKFQRRNGWKLPWAEPKVITNAVRKARGAWRLAATPDTSKLVCTENYQCLWPKAGMSLMALSAILNSPVPSAFIATHEAKHIRKKTLADCPIPLLSPNDVAILERLVVEYIAALNEPLEKREPLFGGDTWQQSAKNILLQMDALILKGYGLPPWLERRLLDFFRGERRPVPFDFGDYFPADFTANIPLWRYISPAFQSSRTDLILPFVPKLNDPDVTEALEEF
jgi:hypothetical protein